ncbi:MAG TPA: hypothetical protein VFB19_00770 [Mycobacterium sp.]|nr:hypothetical protein [Mycobacterium sp.]
MGENELPPLGLIWFSVDDTGGGAVEVEVDVVVEVVVVVVVVLAGPLLPPPHAAVIAPIPTIATALARTGNRRFECVGLMMSPIGYVTIMAHRPNWL